MDAKFLDRENFKSYDGVEFFEDNGGDDSNSLTARSTLRITVNDKQSTFVPADSFLHIRGQIVDAAGSAITTGPIALVNSGWSLFTKATYKINNVVADQFNRPGVVHQPHGLINYSDDYNRGQGKNQLWAPDKGDGLIPNNVGVFGGFRDNAGTIVQLSTVAGDINFPAGTATQTFVFSYNDGPLTAILYPATAVTSPANALRVIGGFVVSTTTIAAVPSIGAIGDEIRFFTAAGERVIPRNPKDNRPVKVLIKSDGAQNIVAFNDPLVSDITGLSATLENSIPINEGYAERRVRGVADEGFSTNRVIEMWLPIREIFRLLQKHPTPMRGATHVLEFDKESDGKNYLFSDDSVAVGAKFKYLHVSWWLPKVTYELSVENEFINALNGEKQLIWDGYQHEESGSRTERAGTWDISTVASMPRKLYAFFQYESRFDDQYQNNMLYDNLDLSNIYLRLNTERYPEYEFLLDYGLQVGKNIDGGVGDDYIRAYNAYLQACGSMAHNYDCTPAVSYEDFKNLFTIYCFDIYDRNDDIFRNNQSIQMKLTYRLRGDVVQPYRITAVFTLDKEFTINYASGEVTKVLSVK